MNQPTLIRLTLRPLDDPVPWPNRLRRLLKMLLRGYGFRCEEVREVKKSKPVPVARPTRRR